MMKKITALFFCFSLFFGLSAESKFSHISFVTFKSNLTYIIGEDCQTLTAERKLKPFSINRYETTYGLWYQTRVAAEDLGYYFENPANKAEKSAAAMESVLPAEEYVPLADSAAAKLDLVKEVYAAGDKGWVLMENEPLKLQKKMPVSRLP